MAAAVWTALRVPVPDWLRWALGTAAALVVSTLLMAALLGPVARRMAGEPRPLSARDREQLTVKDRIDAVNNARATLLQAASGLVVVGGLLFTGAGLVYTARTLDVSARTLDATREGQITDRYTKAVEQLGSSKVDVRLGGIYALERLTGDSGRDRFSIEQVITAYVRVHAHPPRSEVVKGQALVDVAAALDVLSGLDPRRSYLRRFDLTGVDLHGLNLARADLRGAALRGANLDGAVFNRGKVADQPGSIESRRSEDPYVPYYPAVDMTGADLRGAALRGADLRDVVLTGADLRRAHAEGANLASTLLRDAKVSGVYLLGADMRKADLRAADLSYSDLSEVDLTGADLRGANLTGADLEDANVADADLRGVKGQTPAQIRKQAKTSPGTRFS